MRKLSFLICHHVPEIWNFFKKPMSFNNVFLGEDVNNHLHFCLLFDNLEHNAVMSHTTTALLSDGGGGGDGMGGGVLLVSLNAVW